MGMVFKPPCTSNNLSLAGGPCSN